MPSSTSHYNQNPSQAQYYQQKMPNAKPSIEAQDQSYQVQKNIMVSKLQSRAINEELKTLNHNQDYPNNRNSMAGSIRGVNANNLIGKLNRIYFKNMVNLRVTFFLLSSFRGPFS